MPAELILRLATLADLPDIVRMLADDELGRQREHYELPLPACYLNSILFTHTLVPPELEGRGLGSQLARARLDFAREKALKVVPLCWFVAGYMDRHSEYQDLLKS